MSALLRRYARTHVPFPTAQPHRRFGVDPTAALKGLEASGNLVRGELLPGGTERSVRLRRPAPARARASRSFAGRSRRPMPPTSLASSPPGRTSTPTGPPEPAPTACARRSCRCRAWRSPPRSGSVTCCRAGSAPTRPPGSTSSRPVVRSPGSAPAPVGRPGSAFLFARRAAGRPAAPPREADRPEGEIHDAIRELLAATRLLDRPVSDLDLADGELHASLWTSPVRRGDHEAVAPLRSPRPQASETSGRGGAPLQPRRNATASLRRALVADQSLCPRSPSSGSATRPPAELMLERYGIAPRDGPPPRASRAVSRPSRRAVAPQILGRAPLHFVEGPAGSSRSRERRRCARSAVRRGLRRPRVTDPHSPTWSSLKWPRPPAATSDRSREAAAGAAEPGAARSACSATAADDRLRSRRKGLLLLARLDAPAHTAITESSSGARRHLPPSRSTDRRRLSRPCARGHSCRGGRRRHPRRCGTA